MQNRQSNVRHICSVRPEVMALTNQVDKSIIRMLYQTEFLKHPFHDNEIWKDSTTVRKPDIIFTYHTDNILVRVSLVDSPSQRYIHAVLHPRFLPF